jgi:hypothetical protein
LNPCRKLTNACLPKKHAAGQQSTHFDTTTESVQQGLVFRIQISPRDEIAGEFDLAGGI